MSAVTLAPPRPGVRIETRRLAPVLLAAGLAAVYVAISPPSTDLAAQLFRAQLFRREGFGLWDNWWYSGHSTLGYSVLFPAIAAWLSPQLAAGLASTATAALFELLARRHWGEASWVGAMLFAAATAINLLTGRLDFAVGLLPALGAICALDSGLALPAAGLAVLAALISPLAALFTALAAASFALSAIARGRGRRAATPGEIVAIAALLPVALVGLAFPTGGVEPFALSTLWPVLLVCAGALWLTPRRSVTLRIGIGLYAVTVAFAYLFSSPVGSNVARLGTFLAAPLAALLCWPGRRRRLLVVILPLLYVGWFPPLRDAITASSDPAAATSYYAPLLQFLRRQGSTPFRTEIPFTAHHWEAYAVGAEFPLARGWERQLDVADNPLFYDGHLNPANYARWLQANGVRFVAVPDASLDYSARSEVALIDRGLPYLRLIDRSKHWRIYAVTPAPSLTSGPGRLTALSPDGLTLNVQRPGAVVIRVRFSPYWTLASGSGCLSPDGDHLLLQAHTTGAFHVVMSFALNRIMATSPRCHPG